jgi:NADH dehydrogenase FAD-containing subunit
MGVNKVLVLGGNFAGLTAALTVQHEMRGDVDVTVLSASDRFLFNPSLISLPFGNRDPEEITFPLAPTFEAQGINFAHTAATEIDLVAKQVTSTTGTHDFDYLVIATGNRSDFDAVPGLGPGGNAYTITTLDDAVHAGEGWRKLLENPGHVVVGAAQGTTCYGAAYEYLFNVAYHLRKAGLKKQVTVTYVTSEPFIGHFGVGGLPLGKTLLGTLLKKERIDTVTHAELASVEDGRVALADGRTVGFDYAMIVPPLVGQDVVRTCTDITDDRGFVKVRDTYQTVPYDNVYAVGVAAAIDAPWQTPTPVGVPTTGLPSEQQAQVAARNIASQIQGEPPKDHREFGEQPVVCVMDAGNNGVIIMADHLMPPRTHGVLIPGPQAHAMKLGFEKYFMWKASNGHVMLP